MDFKSLINKIDTLETPTKTASTGKTSNVQATPVTLTESAQLRVLSGASTVAHETALMESAKQDKYFPPAKGDKKGETKPKRKSMDTKTNESDDSGTAPNKSNVSRYGGPVVSKKSDQSQWFTSAKSNKKEDDSAESKPKRKSSFPPAKDDDSAESKPKRKSSFPPAKDDDSAESKPKRKSSFPPAKEDKSPNDSSRSSKSGNATKVPVSKYGKSSESNRKDESVTSFTSRFLQMVESKKAGADNKQAKTLKSQAAQIEKLKKQIEKLKEKPVTETTRSTKRSKIATLESRLRNATLKSRINESDDSVYDKSATYKFLQKFISEVGKTLGHTGLVDWDFNRDGSIKIKMNPAYFNLSDKSDQSDSAKASRMLDTVIDKYFRSFRKNGDYFDQPVGGEFSVGIKTGSRGQYESKRNRGSQLAEGRDYSGRRLSFKEMVKLVQESGGQQRIDPVDVELFQWANRVAVNKLGKGTQAEVYAGMVYENMGGIFEMYDVLSESGHFDDEDETYMDPISGRMHPNDRFSSNRVSEHEVRELAKMYDTLKLTEYEFEDEIENLAGRDMSRECRDYIERNITLSEFVNLVVGDDEFNDHEFNDHEFDDISDHSFGGNDFGDDFDDGFDADRLISMRESGNRAAADIANSFNDMSSGMQNAWKHRAAILVLQGRYSEALRMVNPYMKDVDSATQDKIKDKISNVKPVMLNGKVADTSTLEKSQQHIDWINKSFIPWLESLLSTSTTSKTNTTSDQNTALMKRVGMMSLQGMQSEADKYLRMIIKDVNPTTQRKIINKIDNIKPAMINGRLADASSLEKSQQHIDWINKSFIPWLESEVSSGTA